MHPVVCVGMRWCALACVGPEVPSGKVSGKILCRRERTMHASFTTPGKFTVGTCGTNPGYIFSTGSGVGCRVLATRGHGQIVTCTISGRTGDVTLHPGRLLENTITGPGRFVRRRWGTTSQGFFWPPTCKRELPSPSLVRGWAGWPPL